ncbi:polysaccharide biosynthesis/export family protein [Novosphingobium sp. KACC 22771]|uniref:polysaccharide biosynthesis/export family protein n=1 Tax=Novosphingobium sp. KACC 22771 TaxID=3025670 RepID=UPI0023653A04|nr:polysaccharide biosynthesis/export family protein [Novosphingobium sp. KACC 22771]WDF72766.1 polysaccharide export protein [Novosphingobium sp. KACC 22771]
MTRYSRHRQTGSGSPALSLHRLAVGLAPLLLTACAGLPSSGPTVNQVHKEARSTQPTLPFDLVQIDGSTPVQSLPAQDPGLQTMATLAQASHPDRADMIRPGDTLGISVFEVGVSLFGGGSMLVPGGGAAPRTPSVATQALSIEVREDGFIDIPYVGTVRAAGAYPEELAAVIRRRLKTMSESPEVNVAITQTLKNVVYVGGAIAKSGRYRITAAHERLLDAITLAGGSLVDRNEIEIHLRRGQNEVAVRLNQINPGDVADIPLNPGDRIELVRVRPSYTVFGSSDKINQVYFEAKDISLAEAIARVTGPSDNRANPRGVFLCRYEQGADGKPRPVVYQLNMMKTQSYFLAQKFMMRDKDVILFANSSGSMTQKFVNLLSNLFSPVMAVRYAAQ